jgi:hypothetical protein
MFVKQAASAALAMNTAMKMDNGAGAGNGASSAASSTAPTASIGKVLEIVLVTAIVVEAGAAAYLYRDKIADFFNSIFFPRVEQVSNPPGGVNIPNTGNANPTETPSPTLTDTPLPTDTPDGATPQIEVGGNDQGGDNNQGGGQSAPTPEPTKPGLHLGQTPKPDRTQPAPSKDSNKGKDK